jgi:hypothetical protein
MKFLLCQESSPIHSAHGQQFHRSIVANCGFMFLKNTEYGSISVGKNKILSEAGNWLLLTLSGFSISFTRWERGVIM